MGLFTKPQQTPVLTRREQIYQEIREAMARRLKHSGDLSQRGNEITIDNLLDELLEMRAKP